MNDPELPNWIAGAACAASHTFSSPGPAERGPWTVARAGQAEWEAARASLEGRAWGALGPIERAARLEPCARRLAREAAPGSALDRELGGSFGLDPTESCPALLPAADFGNPILPFGFGLGRAGGGRARIVAAHWSEGLGGLARRVLRALVEGWTPIVVADPELPRAADALARAFLASGVDPHTFAVLHDDGRTVARAAASTGAAPGLDVWAVRGDERWSHVDGASDRGGRVTWESLRSRSWIVRRGDDPRRSAQLAVEQAVGRSATLSGQLPGRVGRVLCHELRFAEFTEELLAELERTQAARPPLPLVGDDAVRTLRETCALGLDEGACLVDGGEPWRPLPSDRRAGQRFGLTVFTNVDPKRRLARRRHTSPVLALIRVGADAEACGLAGELDDDYEA